jgi:hypothetical protein
MNNNTPSGWSGGWHTECDWNGCNFVTEWFHTTEESDQAIIKHIKEEHLKR